MDLSNNLPDSNLAAVDHPYQSICTSEVPLPLVSPYRAPRAWVSSRPFDSFRPNLLSFHCPHVIELRTPGVRHLAKEFDWSIQVPRL